MREETKDFSRRKNKFVFSVYPILLFKSSKVVGVVRSLQSAPLVAQQYSPGSSIFNLYLRKSK